MNSQDLHGYKVVLGTTSKWRRALFQKHFAGVEFTYAAADIDEKAIGSRQLPPEQLTQLIANAKADALLQEFKGTRNLLLLTLDQVVLGKDGEILEKPADAHEARRYLSTYDTDHPVTTVSAIIVTECTSGKRVAANDTASLALQKKLPGAVVEKLIEKGDVLYSAGGITVEDELVVPYHGELKGELESILGLPVKATARLLKEGAQLAE